MNKFAVFILTHGRPNRVLSYETLRRQGYTGPIYIIIDDEDMSGDKYRHIYGDQVIEFNKQAIAERYDEADNFNDRRSVFYARNASFEIARDLGLEYFLQLDDDYSRFDWRFNSVFQYTQKKIKNLDNVFDAILEYYKSIPAASIAMAQGGDLIGGQDNYALRSFGTKRKAMNTFFCSTGRPFAFVGRINEDINTYVSEGNKGKLFITLLGLSITQLETQSNSGGMTELYQKVGTYWKTFYTIMYAPSCVKISVLGPLHLRIHHQVDWNSAVPRIIREDWKKQN